MKPSEDITIICDGILVTLIGYMKENGEELFLVRYEKDGKNIEEWWSKKHKKGGEGRNGTTRIKTMPVLWK